MGDDFSFAQTDGEAIAEGEAEAHGENWGETVTPQLVTLYEKMEEVSQYWDKDTQRYRTTALLQNLPVATAAIKVGTDPTQIVGIKYVKPPKIRPGGEQWFLEQIRQRPYVRTRDEVQRHLVDREAQLFGPLHPGANDDDIEGQDADLGGLFGGI